MLSECRQPGKRVYLLGLFLLVFVATWNQPLTAVAQTEPAADEKTPNEDERVYKGIIDLFFEANYGLGTPQYDGLDETFSTVGMLEFKLGTTILAEDAPGIVALREFYTFYSSFDEGLSSSGTTENGEVRSEFSRFGGGNRMGYGYGDLDGAFSFYNQNSMNWTKVKPVDYDAASADAQTIFDRYGDTYHFGTLFEGGFKFNVTQKVGLSLGAEGALIYPRHVFWPWLGSVMIYSGVQSALEVVGARLIDSNPKLGPVLYFILKTGVSWGYYVLAQEDMNWPFSSETPLTMATAKAGLSLAF